MKLGFRNRLDLAITAVLCGLASAGLALGEARGASTQERRPAAEAIRAQVPPATSAPTKAPVPPQSSAPTSTPPPPLTNDPAKRPAADPRSPADARSADPSRSTLESARQRWERLTPEQQIRARERYEQYLALSESERRELAERAQRLNQNSARLQRELPPELRARLSTLEPEKRQELLGELIESEAKEKGQRIRGMLPENVLKRLEAARPEDRARYLTEFKLKQRKRVARHAIDQLGRRLDLPSAEVERLKDLPDDERARAVLDLEKQLSEHEAAEFGLLPGISQRQWDAWDKLPPEEFFEVMQRYEHTRLAQHTGAEDARETLLRGDTERATGAAAPKSGPSAVAVGAPVSAERLRALQKLAEARRLRPSDFFDLAALTKTERAARIEHRRRERCLAAIREGALLPPDRIEELAQARDPQFFEAVRKLLGTRRAEQ